MNWITQVTDRVDGRGFVNRRQNDHGVIGDNRLWRHALAVGLSCLVLAFLPNRALGAVTVSLTQSGFQVGGTGTLFIEVSGSGESVQQMSIDVRVRPMGSVSSSIGLLETPAAAILDDPLYLFKDNSFIEGFDPSLLVNVSTSSGLNDTFNITDSTADLSDVQVTSTRRVGRVDFEHFFPSNTDQASLVGDQFEFEIVSASFTDSSFNPIVPTIAPSVTSAAIAIPEPSPLMLIALVAGLTIATSRRSRASTVPLRFA